jgi:hypothetical protein
LPKAFAKNRQMEEAARVKALPIDLEEPLDFFLFATRAILKVD